MKFLLLFTMSATWLHGQAGCSNVEDRITYVREALAASPSPDKLRDLLNYVATGTRACRSSGDLWHFRSLLEKQLGKPVSEVEYSVKQAQTYSSVALRNNVNPLAEVPRGAVPPYVREKWALLVGVSEFADRKISRLRYTTKDVTDLAKTLTSPTAGRFPSSHVHLLLNEKATLQGIRDEIAWLRANAKPEDLVVLYFASHGSPKTLDLDGLGLSYIVTHDTMLDNLYARAYPMVDLVDQINRDIQARRVVLLIDACHSGSAVEPNTVRAASRSLVAEGAESVNASFAQLRNATGRAVIMSSRAEETSWENAALDGGKGNGYFTRSLIEALQQNNGLSPIKEIFRAVQQQVETRVKTDLGKPQHPVFQVADQGGDIILGVEGKQLANLLKPAGMNQRR